ncbi:hypothetical protein L873DRAFT_1899888 [Choiromyces venosus 120613-1]|uniref:Peptidase S1 domain-containing protein n=1 Tax=Choiromyces venosus 120613-1 TaxID=1336337 RepID=A0A3N4JQ05_9PEZI|nr:hypothetical protein L873DRAFT_1899888 [Choiromyces venosus 120613-1]
MPKVMKTSWYVKTAKHTDLPTSAAIKVSSHMLIESYPNRDPCPVTGQLSHTIGHPKTQRVAMDCGVVGPEIRPLPQSAQYHITEISGYITTVLQQLNRQDAYGLFAGVRENGGQVVPTLIFGLPQVNVPEVVLPPTPNDLPILVKDDCIVLMNGFEATWAMDPVSDVEKIRLEALSVGIEAMGITVCSPSTVEVTSRFKRLVRYTTICPPMDRLRVNPLKEIEAKSLLERFRFQASTCGAAFLDPANQCQLKKGVLSGGRLGTIVSYQFGNHKELLYSYDQELQKLGLPNFSAATSWETRMDWCIFSCNGDRYGGNVYEGDTISETGDLYPGVEVEKIGRSTGTRCGHVNGVMLLHWDAGQIAHDIAIIGTGRSFADMGDSGGCVFVNVNGTYKAAGILIAKNRLHNFALATPLRMILDSAGDYEWA